MQAAEQGDEDRTAPAIVVERDLTFSIDRGQREVGGGITGTKKIVNQRVILTTR